MQKKNTPFKQLEVEASHTTHVGGKGEYLHGWYAYLEGFSSEFVRSIINTYMPNAELILEPFAGVGTTPVSLSSLGITCAYSEINPAMRKVVDVKTSVLKLTKPSKQALSLQLEDLANSIDNKLSAIGESTDLVKAYNSAFKRSIYFEDDTFSLVLSARSLIDLLAEDNKILANSLEVAVMSILIKCSLLKRAGDVRYKSKKELEKGIPDFVDSLKGQLMLMAKDCLACPKINKESYLVANNAKDLINIDDIKADGVITSPPYLNGTNYFRNTKLELWFTRNITSDKCLTRFRSQVVTSGINDVQKDKGTKVHKSIEKLYADLIEKSYDARIPKMVAGYFHEMSIVLEGLAKNTKKNSRICIDIGDSVYAGVHVPTHEILIEIAKDHNLSLIDSVVLRKRRSRDQTLLSQILLVFENNYKHKAIDYSENGSLNRSKVFIKRWDMFKETMPHMRSPFSKRSWGNGLHSVCSYQGKMKPALANFLVNSFTDKGDLVLDPFSGSGTIPFEAALTGRRSLGLDIGGLATSLSNAKLMNHSKKETLLIVDKLADYILNNKPSDKTLKDTDDIKFNKTIPEYFHPDTLNEIMLARDFFIDRHDPENGNWSLVFSCLLHILHGNRPYALSRNSHPITPYAPTGEFVYKNLVEHLLKKVNKSLDTDRGKAFIRGVCYQCDILESWPKNITSVDAIITSPPFFDSTKFYMTNWMRYWFCGWGKDDFDQQSMSFIEVLQKKSFSSYDIIFKACYDRLKMYGIVVFHLGHSDKCNMAVELEPLANKYFEVLDIFTESVEHCEKYGITDKGSVKSHQYLVMRKVS